MLLFVIRHGDPVYSPDSLTPKGHMQAAAVGRRLALHGLDRVYSSPMIRAQQTAQPVCDLLHKKAEILEWTSEALAWADLSYVNQNGRREWCFHQVPTAQLRTPEILALGEKWYQAEPYCFAERAKEGYDRIAKASDAWLESLGYCREGTAYRILYPNNERIAVFCHQGFGTTWLSHLLSITPPLFWSTFDLNHSSVTTIQFANESDGITSPYCVSLSDNSHLYAERLPYQHNNHLDL